MWVVLLSVAIAVFLGGYASYKLWQLGLESLHRTEVPAGANLPLSKEDYHATVLRIREDIAGLGICATVANGLLAGILVALILQMYR